MYRVMVFTDEPAGMMLYEGIFFSRSQAESYLIAHSHSVRHDNRLHHHKRTTSLLFVFYSRRQKLTVTCYWSFFETETGLFVS